MRDINYDNYFWQENGVRLRAIQPEDGELQYHNEFDSVARVLLNYEIELPPTVEGSIKSAEYFSNFSPESGRLMFIIENLDGEILGSFNICGIDEKNGKFSIGMQMDRNHRGKGYGTKAMRILLRYAFLERRLNKFNTCVLDGNIGSATMLKKLGCKEEGRRRQVVYTNGKYVDEIFFGLTKGEFIENEKNINFV